MKTDELTRRRVLKNLMRLSAALAGLGIAKINPLFGQTGVSIADLENTVGVGAQSPKAKAIKVLLFPREEVFRNELGRLPTGLVADPRGGEKCDLFIQPPATACSGMGGNLVSCGGNTCSSQRCSSLEGCDKNSCGKQKRSTHTEPSLFSPEVLGKIMGDPFIKALCSVLKVTTAQDLGSELQRLLIY